MNHREAPRDDAEVLRLFQEQDSLGAESSLWLRAFRQLTKDGKPIGQILAITIPIGHEKKMSIGMLTLTERNRLVFWPVLLRRKCIVVNKPDVELPDHITIEFPSEKLHVTSYDSIGRRLPSVREAWRSAPLHTSGFRLLFTFLVRMSVVTDQDVLVSRKFLMPTSDSDRRTKELGRCLKNIVTYDLPLPGNPLERNYVCLSLYRTTEEITAQSLPSSLMGMSSTPDLVKDWPTNAEFPIVVGQFTMRDHMFCLAAGFPPGDLADDLCFGFPQRRGDGECTA